MERPARTRTLPAQFRRLVGCRVTVAEWTVIQLLMAKMGLDISGVIRTGLAGLAEEQGAIWPGDIPPTEEKAS